MASPDREAATEAQLHDIALRQKRNAIKPEDALRDLETLSVMWRGDRLEVQTLKMLMALYIDTGRYAEALAASGRPRGWSRTPRSHARFRMTRRRCSPSSSSARKATIFRRSMRWRCSSTFAT